MPIDPSESEITHLKDFQKGYNHFLMGFQSILGSFSQFLSTGMNESQKRELLSFRKALDQELDKGQKKIKEILFNLDEKHMFPLVRKEVIRYFPRSLEDPNRDEFVKFHLIFEMLRYFYIESKEGWTFLREQVLQAPFSDTQFRDTALLSYRIEPAFEKLFHLEIFLKRMAFILQIDNPKYLSEYKPTKPKYREKMEYKLSTVFHENLYSILDQVEVESNKLAYEGPKEEIIPKKVKKPEPPPQQTKTTKEDDLQFFLQATGKYSWNSDQHYVLRIDKEKYVQEINLFSSAIKIDLHLGAEEQLLKSEMLRSLTSKEQKAKTAEHLQSDYLDFLTSFFSFCENTILMSMMIPNTYRSLFLFHLGPSHFYMIVKKFMMELNTGYLHCQSQDGKKVIRFIPSEVVKWKVIDFWSKSILPNLGEEKNNLTLLNKLVTIIEDRYREISKLAMSSYDALSDEIKLAKPRVQIFRENMNVWMGAANIIVFKRFVKNKPN